MSKPLSRNQILLAYLVKTHSMPTVTVLMKLAYLIDLVHIKRKGSQLFDYKYRRYTYGPFDENIYRDLNTLCLANYISSNMCYTSAATEYISYAYNTRKNPAIFQTLSKSAKNIVDEVLESVKDYGAKMLTEIAYKTKPMLALGATIGNKENLNKELDLSIE